MDSKIIKTALRKQQLELEINLDLYSEFIINNKIQKVVKNQHILIDSGLKKVYTGSKELCLTKQRALFNEKFGL